mmetsp:Transcript_68335/g.189090  ORF Transcript_68335/g.189090 Transcript_68335/m.189090 type:complete len:205 (-) Transcript_68335:745-1359(-)
MPRPPEGGEELYLLSDATAPAWKSCTVQEMSIAAGRTCAVHEPSKGHEIDVIRSQLAVPHEAEQRPVGQHGGQPQALQCCKEPQRRPGVFGIPASSGHRAGQVRYVANECAVSAVPDEVRAQRPRTLGPIPLERQLQVSPPALRQLLDPQARVPLGVEEVPLQPVHGLSLLANSLKQEVLPHQRQGVRALPAPHMLLPLREREV